MHLESDLLQRTLLVQLNLSIQQLVSLRTVQIFDLVSTRHQALPKSAYASNAYMNGAGDFDAVEAEALTNGLTHEGFDQQGAQLTVSYELSDAAKLKYIFGYGDFDYTFVTDSDYSNSEITSTGNTVLEDVWNLSHELQLFWDVTDDIS